MIMGRRQAAKCDDIEIQVQMYLYLSLSLSLRVYLCVRCHSELIWFVFDLILNSSWGNEEMIVWGVGGEEEWRTYRRVTSENKQNDRIK